VNSPARALVWELWRRNRWGFALLLFLLALSESLVLYVQHLDAQEKALQAEYQHLTTGSLSVNELLPKGPKGPVAAAARIKIGNVVVYDDVLSPGDKLSWGPDGALRLNGKTIATLNLQSTFTVNASGGSKASFSFLEAVDRADRITLIHEWAQTLRDGGLAWSIVALIFSALVLFAIFGSAEPHSMHGFTGLPPRRFSLPVTTGTLVMVPLALGTISMVLLSLAWTRLVLRSLTTAELEIPHLYVASLLTTGLALFQALVWTLPSFPKIRITLITLLMLGLIAPATLPFDARIGAPSSWGPWQAGVKALLAGTWLLAITIAWLGVRLERRGYWTGWMRSDLVGRALQRLQPNPLPFGSPFQAQFWIEWRRNGRFPLTLWAGVLCVGLAAFASQRISAGPTAAPWIWSSHEVVVPLGLAGIIWLAITGLNLARDGTSKRLALSSFTASRPVSTAILFQAKLAVGAVLWLSALLIFGASWFLYLLVTGQLNSPLDFTQESIIAAAFLGALSLHVLVGILPVSLSGRLPGFPWSLLPLLVIYVIPVNLLPWFVDHGSPRALALFFILVLLVTGKLVLAFWAFRRALGLRVVSGWFVNGYLLLWLAAAGLLVWMVYPAADRIGSLEEGLWLIPAAVLLVPLARIGLSPLALASNRHR
jgi:hypothetical protein